MIWFLTITVGLLLLGAPVEYPIAQHAASYVAAVPVRVRRGREPGERADSDRSRS
jgi:hypothetical protein